MPRYLLDLPVPLEPRPDLRGLLASCLVNFVTLNYRQVTAHRGNERASGLSILKTYRPDE